MNKYRVTVYPLQIVWEGEAVNVMDALILGRAHAAPERWEAYMNRPAMSATAPSWSLFREVPNDPFDTFRAIQCKVERID